MSRTSLNFVPILFGIFSAWDPDAHRIIARIAANLISKDTTEYMIRDILFEGAQPANKRTLQSVMAQVAPFADQHSTVHKSYKPYHFVDMPDKNCSGVDLARDCTDGECILGAIPRFAMEVADITLPPQVRSLALKYLIHLVADIHQPMHLGFKGDHGGVGVGLHIPGHRSKHHLHQIWDRFVRTNNGQQNLDSSVHTTKLMTRINTSRHNPKRLIRRQAGSILSQDGKSLTREKLSALTVDIANETVRELTCKYAYSTGTDSFGNPKWIKTRETLDQAYFDSRATVVDLQLIRAGVRLAYILEVIDQHIQLQSKPGLVIDTEGLSELGGELIVSPTDVLRDIKMELENTEFGFEDDKENADMSNIIVDI